MDRKILEKYKKEEDRLLLAKVMDKIQFCETRNRIEHTDFLDESQKNLIKTFLISYFNHSFLLSGGYEEAERVMAIFYPSKIEEIMTEGKWNGNTIFSVIRIRLPNSLKGEYNHRNYLGALMKLGIRREKIGDILVTPEGADIIIEKEIESVLMTGLPELTRFSKAQFQKILLEELQLVEVKKVERLITVSSMRLDNVVSELARCARGKANELMEQDRVLLNFETIHKSAKEVKEGDKVTIRGKGRFEIDTIVRNTKKDKLVVRVWTFL